MEVIFITVLRDIMGHLLIHYAAVINVGLNLDQLVTVVFLLMIFFFSLAETEQLKQLVGLFSKALALFVTLVLFWICPLL